MRLGREHVIEKLIKDNNLKVGVELGVWKGRVFRHLLNSCPGLVLTGVDLYAPQPDNKGPEKWIPGENRHEWDHETYYRENTEFSKQFDGRANIIKDYTYKAAEQFEDESIDFVFIDADHSEEGVKLDIDKWQNKVKSGGYIIGHDINWSTVKRVVENEYGSNYISTHDNVWYVRKP